MTRAQLIHAAMRALTMPVTVKAGELRWEADPEYLVNEADTYLGRSLNRSFYKTNDGIAIAAYQVPTNSRWKGPILVSTDQEAIKYYYGNTRLGTQGVFEYGGLTWYINALHHYQTDNYDPGPLQIIAYTIPPIEQTGLLVLEQANVRIWRGGFALWP